MSLGLSVCPVPGVEIGILVLTVPRLQGAFCEHLIYTILPSVSTHRHVGDHRT